jgi:HAD superfamily hydrolase (TIGR01509 family)
VALVQTAPSVGVEAVSVAFHWRPPLNADTLRQMPSAIQAIIFDCDGTLVDSLPLATEVLNEYLASLNVVLSQPEVAARFGSGHLAESVADLERSIGRQLPAEFIPELRRRRDAAVRERLRPIDGALELVSSLRIPIAVASNGPLHQTLVSLEAAGLLSYFSTNVFSAYDVGSWKPAPELFLHVAKALGVGPSQCAVVEDAPLGVEAGLAAGMTVFALCDDDRWSGKQVHFVQRLCDITRYLS